MVETLLKRRAQRRDTPSLCDALIQIDIALSIDGTYDPPKDAVDDVAVRKHRASHTAIIEVLRERHPEADAAFCLWAGEADTTVVGNVGAVHAITRAAMMAHRRKTV